MTSIPITINRDSGEIVTVKPDDSSSIQKQLMGDIVASLTFELNASYNFILGDYADILGERYYISKPPAVTKKSRYNYLYTLTMESRQYLLRNAQYMFYNSDNVLSEGDFSLTGTADDFMKLLILNANRIDESWVKGGVIATGYKTLTFSKEDCLSVLSKIAEAFETEFFIEDNKIHLAKRKQQTTYNFMYGRNYGLYTINREPTGNPLYTRLYVFGGEQNLPADYPSSRLRLPGGYDNLVHNVSWIVQNGNTIDGGPTLSWVSTAVVTFDFPLSATVKTITFESRIKGSVATTPWDTTTNTIKILLNKPSINEVRAISKDASGNVIATSPFFEIDGAPNSVPSLPILTQTKALPYLENNTNKYGIIEGTLVIDDIFPQRTGKVTAADVTNFYKFKDTNLDFDINAQLAPGLTAKVVFQTGQLAGYKFEISKFDNATKEFTLLKNKDEAAIDVPSAMLRPAIGDQYILVDIIMPGSYVIAAELLLQSKAQEYLNTASEPSYKYSIQCDPAYFRKKNIYLEIGDMVNLTDNELQVNRQIRIISLTRSLADEFEYGVELSDVIAKGTLSAIQSAQISNSNGLSNVASQVNNNALLNGTFIGTLKVEQGTINMKDIETATDLSAMKKLWIDASGKVWKEA